METSRSTADGGVVFPVADPVTTRSGGFSPAGRHQTTTSCGAGNRLHHRSYGAVNYHAEKSGALDRGRDAPAGARCGIAGSGPRGPTPSPPGPADVPRAAPQPAREPNLRTRPCGAIGAQPCEFPCGQLRRSPSGTRRARRPWSGDATTVPSSAACGSCSPKPTADVPIDDAVRRGPAAAAPDRPWVGLCMIASLDGSTVVDGRSGALGNPTDTRRARRPAPGRRRHHRRRRRRCAWRATDRRRSPASASAW